MPCLCDLSFRTVVKTSALVSVFNCCSKQPSATNTELLSDPYLKKKDKRVIINALLIQAFKIVSRLKKFPSMYDLSHDFTAYKLHSQSSMPEHKVSQYVHCS